MAVTNDILRTWRDPRGVMRRHLALGRREDRAIAFLMIGCVVMFIARWPALAREAAETGAEMDRLIAYGLFGVVIILPLAMYAVAFVVFLLGRPFLSRLSAYGARLSLFWAWLAASPLALLAGLVAGFSGDPLQERLVGALWLAAIVWFTVQGLRTAAEGDAHA